MGEVRVYTEEFAAGVATLFFRAVRGQTRPPGDALPGYFSEIHLSNPWATPDIPTVVYLEKDEVVGALGVVPRPMEYRGRPIMMATTTLYMVHPDHRKGPAAVQLLGRTLKGPQDMTWGDCVSGSVSMFWSALGGHAAPLYAFNWTRILRPFGTARMGLDRIGGLGRLLKVPSAVLAAPTDFLLSKLPLPTKAPVSPYRAQPVSAEQLLECILELDFREALKPSYSMPSFAWLMSEAAKVKDQNLRMLTVSDQAGARCGWLIYYAMPGGVSWVFQIGTRRRTDFPGVLSALFRDAWEQGSVCVKGSSIPPHLKDLTDQFCIFRLPHNRAVVHSKNPELANAVRLGEAAVTTLDGISWLRFSREQW